MMSTHHEKVIIEALITAQMQALHRKDVNAAVENYHLEVRVFDVVGPLAQRGRSAVKTRLTEWLSGFRSVTVVSSQLEVEADNNIAYSNCFNHVIAETEEGKTLDMFWRETLCWQKISGEWMIMTAHSSVPFDAGTGMASTGLKP